MEAESRLWSDVHLTLKRQNKCRQVEEVKSLPQCFIFHSHILDKTHVFIVHIYICLFEDLFQPVLREFVQSPAEDLLLATFSFE